MLVIPDLSKAIALANQSLSENPTSKRLRSKLRCLTQLEIEWEKAQNFHPGQQVTKISNSSYFDDQKIVGVVDSVGRAGERPEIYVLWGSCKAVVNEIPSNLEVI